MAAQAALRGRNQLGHVSHDKVVDLRVADRSDENHAVHPDAAGGLLHGQLGESGIMKEIIGRDLGL